MSSAPLLEIPPSGASLKPVVLGLGITLPILAIVFVCLRLHARFVKRLDLESDDWTIVAALIFTIGVSVTIMLDSQLGNLGGHEDPTSPTFAKETTVFVQLNWVLQLLVCPAVGFTKGSVLLFYKRIFFGRKFAIFTWISLAITAMYAVSFFFAFLFECLPISVKWNPSEGPGTCVNEAALFTAGLLLDILTDVLILSLPVYNVWKLQMPVTRKLAVISIFLLGGFVVVAGIVRFVFLVNAFTALEDPHDDVSYNFAPAIYWTIVELNVGVISACLPCLRPLYSAYKLDQFVNRTWSFITFRTRGLMTTLQRNTGSGTADNIRLNSTSDAFHDRKGYNTPGQSFSTLPEVLTPHTHNNDHYDGIMVRSDIVQSRNMF